MSDKTQYYALCRICWGKYHNRYWQGRDKAVYHNGKPVEIIVGKEAKTPAEAKLLMGKDGFEFVEWR